MDSIPDLNGSISFLICIWGSLLFILFFYFLRGPFLTNRIPNIKKRFMISKIGGGLLFYFGSALFLETFGHDQAVFFAINGGFLEAFIILSILCPLLFFAAKKPAQQKLYPEYKTKEWTIKDSLFSAFCWFIFLSGYEYLFRGLLFYSLIPSFGFWNAVSISTALYVLAHLHKEASETFSCIFMGIIFCIIAWKSGGILIPSILHSLIVIITENFCELHRKNAKASS